MEAVGVVLVMGGVERGQVARRSAERKRGASVAAPGSRVKVEIVICCGFLGFTAMLGSLSRPISLLMEFGITSTSRTCCADKLKLAVKRPTASIVRYRSALYGMIQLSCRRLTKFEYL